MNKTVLLRALSALIAVLMLAQPVLAEDVGVVESELVESIIEETEALDLSEVIDEAPAAPVEEPFVEPADDPVGDTSEALNADMASEPAVETSAEPDIDVLSEADTEIPADEIPAPPAETLEIIELTGESPDVVEAPNAVADKAAASFEAATQAPADDPGTLSFSTTESVSGATWKDVNLVRSAGFTGKLARVSGMLTLVNVKIEGKAAGDVNLLDYFDLDMGASIAVTDDAPLRLNFSALSINKGSKKTLKATYNGKAVSAKRIKWKTSGKKLASVSYKGVITAKRKGAATITASYMGNKAVCRLDITGVVYPKSVKLNKKKLTLALNSMMSLKAKLKPANPDDKTLVWTSTNPSVVSVDENGRIAGLAAGKATIKVTTCNGKSASCKVTVKAIKPKSLTFSKLYVTMHPGETFQTGLKLKPENTSYPGATYTSDNTSVATVDASGVITAVGVGTATITAVSTASQKIQDTCKVCVIKQGAAQLEGLIIGLNPGHQKTMIKKRYPMAPGSHSYGPGVKVGATGNYTHQTEYSVVLDVGLRLKRILEEHGAKVVITRTTNDVQLTNIDRAKMLNAAGVDVALQLHCNSCSNSSKTGQSGYIRTTGQWFAESKALARQITKHISKTTGFANRGINYYNDYMSLNWTTTPSVLLEMGYLSNSSDDHKLAKPDFREKLAQGIYEGLCAYFGR